MKTARIWVTMLIISWSLLFGAGWLIWHAINNYTLIDWLGLIAATVLVWMLARVLVRLAIRKWARP